LKASRRFIDVYPDIRSKCCYKD